MLVYGVDLIDLGWPLCLVWVTFGFLRLLVGGLLLVGLGVFLLFFSWFGVFVAIAMVC